MDSEQTYPIGTPGEKWGQAQKTAWLQQQTIHRTYQAEVIAKLEPLKQHMDLVQYGALSFDSSRYPLFVVKTRNWQPNKKTVLVTGGVHGYETSGVQGAIRFLETKTQQLDEHFNIIVAPCVSPWAYETINRWNPYAVDPNRSFSRDGQAQESTALMQYIASLNVKLSAHIDLHETTDSDNSEFRPALSARDAVVQKNWNIPDGFYLVGNSKNPSADFQQAIINAVANITHIAPADANQQLIGVALAQPGVINYAAKSLGLCMGFSDATYCTTTEVYPDSPKVDAENCILAQVAAITSSLEYIINADQVI